jgi:gamma-glutamyltranspeptidase / glutathione hydrolase
MSFNYTNPYPTTRAPLFARNVVATSHPLAAQAGLTMLAHGGNAVDAIIATAAALTIVEPVSNGLGSDAFAIVWDGQKLHGLNASGTAPAAWDLSYFERKHGGKVPERGWDSVTIPGAVAGWAALHGRMGKLPFADCIAPAIDLARRGYGVTPIVVDKWNAAVPIIKSQPGFADTFMPNGRAPRVGERFKMENAARALERIAESNGRDFYEGAIAQALVAHSDQHGGAMQLSDLSSYQCEWVDTISQRYRGYDLHEIPPNGQGIAALMALGMLEHFDLAGLHPDSAQCRHLQIEAMKAAFADVYQHVADSRYMTHITPADLLDPAYLRERAKSIRTDKASAFEPAARPTGGTVYLTAADESGMMVSFIQSNYMGFGSGIVEPEFGVSLQNRGFCFSASEASPNCVAPGKRPFQTIIPAFLMKDGLPQMSFGVMGGNMQPQGHLQTLSRMLDHHQSPQAACDAPRWKVHRGLDIDLEHTMSQAQVDQLSAMGHRVSPTRDSYMDFGSGQFIWRLSDNPEDGYVAASDSRRDGQAVGF